MKTYLPLLFICALFLLNSCKSHLTTNNYVYEGDLYQAYLNAELTMVNDTIAELQSIIDNNQGNEQTKTSLEKSFEKKSNFQTELAGISGLINGLIIPPKPPCPIEDRTCLPSDFKYFLLSATSNISKLQILTEGGQEILMISDIGGKKLKGTQGQFKIQLIRKKLTPGNIKIKVTRKDQQNNEFDFEIKATVTNQ